MRLHALHHPRAASRLLTRRRPAETPGIADGPLLDRGLGDVYNCVDPCRGPRLALSHPGCIVRFSPGLASLAHPPERGAAFRHSVWSDLRLPPAGRLSCNSVHIQRLRPIAPRGGRRKCPKRPPPRAVALASALDERRPIPAAAVCQRTEVRPWRRARCPSSSGWSTSSLAGPASRLLGEIDHRHSTRVMINTTKGYTRGSKGVCPSPQRSMNHPEPAYSHLWSGVSRRPQKTSKVPDAKELKAEPRRKIDTQKGL
jgi:hypothetical protein